MLEAYYNEYMKEFIKTIESLDYSVIEAIYQRMENARESGKQVFVIGNGGSAASASHWACDFGKGINVAKSKRYRLIALTDNIPSITAYGNDVSYEDIFAEQLKNVFQPGDVVIGLSVSGSSENIIRAFDYVKQNNGTVISLIGNREGKMKDYSDISLIIPSNNYGVVEDVHMYVNHVISQYIRRQNELETKQHS